MGSCYSGDHIARDHKHKVITTCNTEKPQQLYRLKIAWNDIGQSCLSRQTLITLLTTCRSELLQSFKDRIWTWRVKQQTFMSDGQTNVCVWNILVTDVSANVFCLCIHHCTCWLLSYIYPRSHSVFWARSQEEQMSKVQLLSWLVEELILEFCLW